MKPDSAPLLTQADLIKLAEEILVDKKISADADMRIAKNTRRLDAGMQWAPEDFDPFIEAARAVPEPPKAEPVKPAPIIKRFGRDWSKELTWMSEVERLVNACDNIEKQEVLNRLLETPLGKKASKGFKGFYNAVSRLSASGKITQNGTKLYSRRAIELMEARGESLPTDRKVSSSGVLVVGVLGKYQTGLTGGQLQQMVSSEPNAPESLRKHKHYIYGVLNSLIESGHVVKRRGIYHLAAKDQTQH